MTGSPSAATALMALMKLPRIGRRAALRIVTSRPEESDLASYRESILERAVRAKLPERDLAEAWKRAEDEIEKGAAAGIHAYSIHDRDYPARLSEIPDPPAVLFVKGDPRAIHSPKSVAIVGTREPTPYGETVARRSGKTAVEAGFAVVSGLAHGCDTLAHEGCLDAPGVGVAVMAHGLDKVLSRRQPRSRRAASRQRRLPRQRIPGRHGGCAHRLRRARQNTERFVRRSLRDRDGCQRRHYAHCEVLAGAMPAACMRFAPGEVAVGGQDEGQPDDDRRRMGHTHRGRTRAALAERATAHEFRSALRNGCAKPHCVQLYFSTTQYQVFRRAILPHGGTRARRGLAGKEQAIIRVIRAAEG